MQVSFAAAVFYRGPRLTQADRCRHATSSVDSLSTTVLAATPGCPCLHQDLEGGLALNSPC